MFKEDIYRRQKRFDIYNELFTKSLEGLEKQALGKASRKLLEHLHKADHHGSSYICPHQEAASRKSEFKRLLPEPPQLQLPPCTPKARV